MRIVLIAVVVVVLGAVGALLFVLSSLDDLIQEAVQTYGSEITQAKVSLAEVDIDLTSGRGSLRGLSIGNPAGFDTPSAFELGAISITIDTGTVTDDTIVITEIVIEAPVITYELRSEEHTSELQSRRNLVCRLLLEKKKIYCTPYAKL